MVTLYRREIEAAARETGVDPDLVEAVVLVESSGQADAFRHEPDFWARYMRGTPAWKDANPRRVSSSYGLCQVMYLVAKEHGFTGLPEELFVPEVNLGVGCRVLTRLLTWAGGDIQKAVGAYNAGKGGWSSPEAARYVQKVLTALEQVKAVRHG
jgi:soluble lytic murein transglycosylase-like protein